jgi:RNA polymerase sigma-70 factor, ECF subfamily
MLHDPQAAEDAVQEASLLPWRKLRQLREGTEMRPWFLGIVANQCRNVRRGRWWSVLKRDNLESPVRPGPDQSGSIDLRRALGRLEPGKRTVVILYFYLDLSLDEIGRVVGATPGATKARLYRAVRELRLILDWEEG